MARESLTDADFALLDRFFAGEASSAEKEAVQTLLAHRPDVAERVEAIIRGVRNFLPEASDARQSWARLAATLRSQESVATRRPRRAITGTFQAPTGRMRTVGYVAAVCAVSMAVVVLGWHRSVTRIGSLVAAPVMTYTTQQGERANITLPDGNTVALGVASRLEVPTDYSAGDRTVRLNGEALFTVVHHMESPFTVVAGNTMARVLGTNFVVRHYSMDTATVVAVQDGKVAILEDGHDVSSGGSGPLVLSARQAVEVMPVRVPHVRLADSSFFSFARGELIIKDESLAAALPDLDRWFNVDIRLGDPSFAQQRMQGKFGEGSVGDLTTILGLMFDVRTVRDGRTLTLYPK